MNEAKRKLTRGEKWLITAGFGLLVGVVAFHLYPSLRTASGLAIVGMVALVVLKHLGVLAVVVGPVSLFFGSVRARLRAWFGPRRG